MLFRSVPASQPSLSTFVISMVATYYLFDQYVERESPTVPDVSDFCRNSPRYIWGGTGLARTGAVKWQT